LALPPALASEQQAAPAAAPVLYGVDMNAQLAQYDYCVPEAQRLADLFGIAQDLDATIRYCDLHIEIDPTESGSSVQEKQRREHTRQALCRAALVMYGRAWGWGAGVRPGISEDHRRRLSSSEQALHDNVKALRDKWVAHAVNHFDDVRVHIGISFEANESPTICGVGVNSSHISGFTRDWMIEFWSLVSKVLLLVNQEFVAESERLSLLVRGMTIEEIVRRPRVDSKPLRAAALAPRQARRRFK
jgi:hypothetical protein